MQKIRDSASIMIKQKRALKYIFSLSIILGVILIIIELFKSDTQLNLLKTSKSVAIVNDVQISEDQYLKYVSNLNVDSLDENDSELLEIILEKMIEEELLLQKGLELNLHKQDVEVRKLIIQQVIEFILQIDQIEPEKDEVKNYFNLNKDKYLKNKLIKFDYIFYDKNLFEKEVIKFIKKNNFDKAKIKFHQKQFLNIQNAFFSEKDCEQLFGITICKELFKLNIKSISKAYPYDDGYFIFKIIDHKDYSENEDLFNIMFEKILFDYVNYRDDKNFRDYIQYLKDNAKITRYNLSD